MNRHPEPRKRARALTSVRVGVRDLVLALKKGSTDFQKRSTSSPPLVKSFPVWVNPGKWVGSLDFFYFAFWFREELGVKRKFLVAPIPVNFALGAALPRNCCGAFQCRACE